MSFNSIEEALEQLKKGKMIIVVDDEDRENEGDLICLADHATPEVINFMITYGKGMVCVPITMNRAEELQLPLMVDYNTDRNKTAFTITIDSLSATTGISAYERSATIYDLINPNLSAADFRRPGHIFPLIARPGGVLQRAGHTEAAVDLAILCGAYPAAVICEIIRDDGSMARVPDLLEMAEKFDLKMINIQDLIQYRRQTEKLVERIATVDMPTKFGQFTMVGYTSVLDQKEHVALIKGEINPEQPVLVRVHSECLSGDIFGSLRCDCGPQLDASIKYIENEGTGIVLYMRQEGRGIGLLNKLKAYELQEDGLDTIEANLQLGFQADLREYGIGAQILYDLGVRKMRLLTNNPRKILGLKGYDLEVVEVLPIEMPIQTENRKYMETKKQKLGHDLSYV